MLFGAEVPSAGKHTEFADLRAAYDALDDRMKERIDELVAEHTNHTPRLWSALRRRRGRVW